MAATVSVALSDYTSWIPGRAKGCRIARLRQVRLTRTDILGVAIGLGLLTCAAVNETSLAL